MKRLWLLLALCASAAQAAPVCTLISNGNAGAATGTGTLTPTIGTHAAGDLLLYRSATRTTSEVSAVDPTGYTLIAAGHDNAFEFWGKIAASGAEVAPSISWSGSSHGIATVAVYRSTTGWPDIASILNSYAAGTGSTTVQRYRSRTIAADNLCIIQAAFKGLTTGIANVPTAVALTAGFTASGFAVTAGVNNGMAFTAQFQSQTTATNVAQNEVAVTGNSDLAATRGLTLALTMFPEVPPAPVITAVDGDNSITWSQTNLLITGTTFKATQGDGFVKIICEGGTIEQSLTVDSWSATSIQVDIASTCETGAQLIRVQNSDDQPGDFAITLTAPSGTTATQLSGGLIDLTWSVNRSPSRLYGTPLDLQDTSQVYVSNAVGCSASAVIARTGGWLDIPDTCTSLDVDISRDGLRLGTPGTIAVSGVPPFFTGSAMPNRLYVQNQAIATVSTGGFYLAGDAALTSYALQQYTTSTNRTNVNGAVTDSLTLVVDSFTNLIEGDAISCGGLPVRIGYRDPLTLTLGLWSAITCADNATVAERAVGNGAVTGLTVNSGSGAWTGTPTVAAATAELFERATDASSMTADSNAFSITVSAVSPARLYRRHMGFGLRIH